MRHPILAAALGATAVGLAAPGAAEAATYTVDMGTPPSVRKALPQDADLNAFFPGRSTIHVGDKVRFEVMGFHNLDLPAKGGKVAALIAPTGKTISGENDAAGKPFWFNGQQQLGFALAPMVGYGKSFTYNGSKAILTGLPTADKVKPVTVKFTKKGTFSFFCAVHPGMKGQVKVVAARSKAPSVKAQKQALAREATKAVAAAKKLEQVKPPNGTVYLGAYSSSTGAERLAFIPGTASVKVGDTLTFKMGPRSVETHTATTGPGNIEDPNSYIGGIAKAFEGFPFPGVAVYPSDPPPAAAALTPGLHGNGFWSSGALDNAAASPPPNANVVKFAQAGTYTFYCLIHPFMKATVTAS